MSELKNYAEMSFSNPILLDVFGNHMENSVLASFVSANGTMTLKFKAEPPVEPPKNCEDVLGLLYSLLESNSETAVGKAFIAKENEIMRETILRISKVLDGFGNVKITLHTTEASPENPDAEVQKHTEFTLNRTKSGSTVIKQ
ncbi:MAG: hypothetical protein LUG26_01940 [Ruminococcus sp.]|nr:hypothetical protein [Ruminococcus sp.]